MLDKNTFTALYMKHGALVRRVCARKGVSKADLDEVCQEVWTELWRRRAAWPDPEPSSPSAYLAKCAEHKAKMHARAAGAQKRSAVHVPLEEDRTSVASARVSRPPEAESLVERTSLGTLMRRFAEQLPSEKRETLLEQLGNKSGRRLSEEPSAVRRGFNRMIAASRRRLGISVRYPKGARVDPLQRLSDAVHGAFVPAFVAEPTDAE